MTQDAPGLEPLAYRPADAARVIGCARATVYDLVASGKLPGHKLGTATVILADDLRRFLADLPLTGAEADR